MVCALERDYPGWVDEVVLVGAVMERLRKVEGWEGQCLGGMMSTQRTQVRGMGGKMMVKGVDGRVIGGWKNSHHRDRGGLG
jgi:hypothetical protein